jgi:hypothetical protein
MATIKPIGIDIATGEQKIVEIGDTLFHGTFPYEGAVRADLTLAQILAPVGLQLPRYIGQLAVSNDVASPSGGQLFTALPSLLGWAKSYKEVDNDLVFGFQLNAGQAGDLLGTREIVQDQKTITKAVLHILGGSFPNAFTTLKVKVLGGADLVTVVIAPSQGVGTVDCVIAQNSIGATPESLVLSLSQACLGVEASIILSTQTA